MLVISFGLTGCVANDKELETLPSSSMAHEVDTTSSSEQQTVTVQSEAMTTKTGIKITLEQAIKEYQTIYPEKTITSLELESSFGKYSYEIKGVDDTTEYSVEINAQTGEVKKEREESLDNDEKNGIKKQNAALDLTKLKSIEEISALAEENVGSGEAMEWSLERELSITYWEVKVVKGTKEVSVKIDAQTDEILEKEWDD